MLRPFLAFGALALAAFVLAPTVLSVHQGVEDLHFERDIPWKIWEWNPEEPPTNLIMPPQCGPSRVPTYSEVTEWPERIRKNETYRMGGIVTVPSEAHRGLPGVKVDLFLNETKELPGEFLGTTITDGNGRFVLEGRFKQELQATKYHLVAHAHERPAGCVTYHEHWSDPEMEVLSKTRIVIDAPPRAVLGREIVVGGYLLDDVDGPVRNAEVDLRVGDQYLHLTTDAAGRFETNLTPERLGDLAVEADFDATEYYDGSRETATIEVVEEAVELFSLSNGRLEIVRTQPKTLHGRVLLQEGVEPKPLTVRFDGLQVVACDGCAPASEVEVAPDAEGVFSVTIVAPTSQPLGGFAFALSGGGLKRDADFQGSLSAPVTVTLDAQVSGFFAKEYRATARAVDDAGKPAPGPIVLEGPDGWHALTPGADGAVAHSAATGCGAHPVRAHYNGTATHYPGVATKEVNVCPYLAVVPPFLLDMPWWGWLLILAAIVAGYLLYGHLRARYATTITAGPPLAVEFVEPRDAAAGIVGVGEAATLTARLEDPLPEGHVLRMGTYRRMQEVEVGPDLRATFTLLPEDLGEIPLRAEIVNGKGRVVSRRSATLRVVRYAQEIERRHLALRRRTLGDDASPVTPREFEAWLQERSPDVDPAIAQRLVAVFEEADYGPRDASRQELLAYMEAEEAFPEVSPRALA